MMRGRHCARPSRAAAAVCTLLGLAAMIAAPLARRADAGPLAPSAAATPPVAAPPAGEDTTPRGRAAPEVPEWIAAENGAGAAFVYPPLRTSTSAQPVTVLLHGMCGHPQSACGPFVEVSTSRGWLVCPRGQDPCGGGARWRLRADDAYLVDSSVRALARLHAGEVDGSAPRVLVGFSLGGTAAVHIAEGSQGTYSGLVVIASQVHPDGARLRQAGILRVVLAAGDLDMTSAPLQEDAGSLRRTGLSARFVSLGRFGHGYPADMAERMGEPMRWVAGGGEPAGAAVAGD
jgi:predicted esterase